MNMLHQSSGLQRLDGVARQLRLQAPLRLETGRAGWLQVSGGRVWLTRDGGGDDHVLAAGSRIWLGRGERVVVEPWRTGEPATLGWQRSEAAAQPPVRLRRASAAPAAWRGLALALRALAGGLLAAARSADSRASRAHGAMPVGESIASSGALQ